VGRGREHGAGGVRRRCGVSAGAVGGCCRVQPAAAAATAPAAAARPACCAPRSAQPVPEPAPLPAPPPPTSACQARYAASSSPAAAARPRVSAPSCFADSMSRHTLEGSLRATRVSMSGTSARSACRCASSWSASAPAAGARGPPPPALAGRDETVTMPGSADLLSPAPMRGREVAGARRGRARSKCVGSGARLGRIRRVGKAPAVAAGAPHWPRRRGAGGRVGGRPGGRRPAAAFATLWRRAASPPPPLSRGAAREAPPLPTARATSGPRRTGRPTTVPAAARAESTARAPREPGGGSGNPSASPATARALMRAPGPMACACGGKQAPPSRCSALASPPVKPGSTRAAAAPPQPPPRPRPRDRKGGTSGPQNATTPPGASAGGADGGCQARSEGAPAARGPHWCPAHL
jgi:hypothetical protein